MSDVSGMAQAYSDDLRKKFLEAHGAGKGTLRELAGRFGVSVGWAFKVSAALRRTGSMSKPAQRRHGRESKVDRVLVAKLVRLKPDIVLRELQADLAAEGVRVSIALIAVVLRQMGLRLKKSRSTPPSATPKPTASAANSSSARSPRSRRKT
jgi:transposase